MNVYLPNKRLPSTYQEVEYIASSGTQYINTGYIPTIYDSVEIKFKTQASTSDTNLYGSRISGGNQDWTVWINTSSGKGIAVHYPYTQTQGRDTSWFYTSDIISSPVELKITPQYCYVNNSIKYTFTDTRTAYTGTYNAYLFAQNQNGIAYNIGKFTIYYCKIYNNGVLQRDFVPCYRKSDSVTGMYDLVNSVFYTNAGSGTFSKGNDVTMAELQNAYIGEYKGYIPGSNTVAYYPLTSTSTIQDESWNNRDLINTGSVVFGTYQGVNCAYFNGTTNSQLYNTSISFSAYPTQTVLVRMYITGTSTSVYQTIYHIGITSQTGKLGSWFKYGTGLCIGSWYGGYESIKSGNINGSWHLLVNVTNGTSSTQYLDGALYQSFTNSLSGTQTGLYIGGAQQSSSERLSGYESEFIVESKVRTAQEILNYYNQTKSKYGL